MTLFLSVLYGFGLLICSIFIKKEYELPDSCPSGPEYTVQVKQPRVQGRLRAETTEYNNGNRRTDF